MANYTGLVLTKKGRNLQAKAQSGVTLNFTKVSIGDGQHTQNLEDIESLLNPLQNLAITDIQVEYEKCIIRTNVTNEGLTQGFYIKELGLFANDPDLGEILYAISLATESDFLPANGGTTAVNNEFEINVITGNVANITANISNAGYVSREELNRIKLQLDATIVKVDKNVEDISKMGLRLSNLEQSYLNNFTANHFTEDLTTLNDVKVTRGVYDSVNRRLVI